MTDIPDADAMKAFNKSIVDEFRANGGKVGGQFEGANLLLLTTTGAKSGQPRLAPLAYFTVDGKLIIIGSKAGADTEPRLGAQSAGQPAGAHRGRHRRLRRHQPRVADSRAGRDLRQGRRGGTGLR